MIIWTIPIRSEKAKEYWEKIRGCKLEDIKNEWDLYRGKVKNETEKTYCKFKKIINPNKLLRGKDKYHIDHKF